MRLSWVKNFMEYVKLNNGVKMPILGFGVYQIPKEEIKKLDTGDSLFFSHLDPKMVKWFDDIVKSRRTNEDCRNDKKNW